MGTEKPHAQRIAEDILNGIVELMTRYQNNVDDTDLHQEITESPGVIIIPQEDDPDSIEPMRLQLAGGNGPAVYVVVALDGRATLEYAIRSYYETRILHVSPENQALLNAYGEEFLWMADEFRGANCHENEDCFFMVS